MSLASKVTFGLCCATSVTIIVYVHYQQQFDREQLHLGVVRDIELQQRRKAENLFLQVQQQELTRRLQEAESKDHANS